MKVMYICPTIDKPTCGIAKYTGYLAKAMPSHVSRGVLANHITLRDHLARTAIDVVHFQYEYSFASAERLCLMAEQCLEFGAKFFITYHTLAHVPANRVSAHKLSHTNLAKCYGDFTIIPSPIPPLVPQEAALYETKLSQPQLALLKGSFAQKHLVFGQCHPHKGIWEALHFISERPEELLVCICSRPIAGDATFYDKCMAYAMTLKNVLWLEQYLEDGEVLSVANHCSRAWFPYSEYGSVGVSAAVKLLLQSTCSIFCSNASHFSDLPLDVVTRCSTMADFATATPTARPKAIQRYLAENTYAAAALEHLRLYKKL